MKLHIMSDLHMAGCGMKPLTVQGDALILAGDITDGIFELLPPLIQAYTDAGLPILYVPGNHEFEGNTLSKELKKLHRACASLGVTLLHNRVVEIAGVRFIGTTLWTDFEFGGKRETSKHLAQNTVCDFKKAWKTKGVRLTPSDTIVFHRKALAFLERTFAQGFEGPSVVITHHGVSPRSINRKHEGDSLNAVYVTDLTDRILKWQPVLMVHGHVHHQCDYRIGNTRVVVNPRGRVAQIEDRDGSMLEMADNDEFDVDLTIEV